MVSELEEARQLLATATFPRLRTVISRHVASLEKEQRDAEAKDSSAHTNSRLKQGKDVSETDNEPSSSAAPAAQTAMAKRPIIGKDVTYIPIEDFAWDQGGYNSGTVEIFVDLAGVGTVKDNCKINFTSSSFDLTVENLAGKSYRLVKDNLDKDIVPESSKMIVKANKIVIKLQKKKGEYSFDHWTSLTAKKPRTDKSADATKDPMGGMMDLMKDLYQDGDDNMKKIIGESMMKSMRGEKPSVPSMDDI